MIKLSYCEKRLWPYVLSCFHLLPERYGQTELLYQYRASVCWRAIKINIWPLQKAQNDGVRCHLLWQTCCAFGQCAICQIITALLVRFHSRLTCSSTNTVRCWRQLCPARSSVNASWLLPSPTYLLLFNFYQILLCLLIPLTSYFASLRCKQLIKVFSNNNCCCALY